MHPGELKQKHISKLDAIEKRLQDFREVFQKSDYDVFTELCFCLLTPQSKAKSAAKIIESLKEKNLILNGDAQELKKWMASIRFNNNKSQYLVLARELFSDGNGGVKIKEKINAADILSTRKWLVDNVKGMGYKEASHFLRNVGYGDDIAILDRHILKHLFKNNVIPEIPKSLTVKKYLEIEEAMKRFSKEVDIPMSHLDMVWWSEETGEIFK